MGDKSKNEQELKRLEDLQKTQAAEEEELQNELRRLKKREFEEMAKKAKMVEGKREILKGLKK